MEERVKMEEILQCFRQDVQKLERVLQKPEGSRLLTPSPPPDSIVIYPLPQGGQEWFINPDGSTLQVSGFVRQQSGTPTVDLLLTNTNGYDPWTLSTPSTQSILPNGNLWSYDGWSSLLTQLSPLPQALILEVWINGNTTVSDIMPFTVSSQNPLTMSASQSCTISTTYSPVAGLSFAIGAGERWMAVFDLLLLGSIAGMTFQITGPASPSSVNWSVFGNSSSATAFNSECVTESPSYPTTANAYSSNFNGFVRIYFLIVNGSNAGTVQLNFASVAQPNKTQSAVLHL